MIKKALVSVWISVLAGMFLFAVSAAFGAELPSDVPPAGLVTPTFSGVTTPVVYSPAGQTLILSTTYGISVVNEMGGSDSNVIEVNPSGVSISSDGESGIGITADGGNVRLKGDATIVEGNLELEAFDNKNNPYFATMGGGDLLYMHSDSGVTVSAPSVVLANVLSILDGDARIMSGDLIMESGKIDSKDLSVSNKLSVPFGASIDVIGSIANSDISDPIPLNLTGQPLKITDDVQVSGWLGVGTSPSYNLDVLGNGRVNGDLIVNSKLKVDTIGTYVTVTSAKINVSAGANGYATAKCSDSPGAGGYMLVDCGSETWYSATAGGAGFYDLDVTGIKPDYSQNSCTVRVRNEGTVTRAIQAIARCWNPEI